MKCHKTMDEQPGTSKTRHESFMSFFFKCYVFELLKSVSKNKKHMWK
jgi:hypothetical protein